MARSGTKQQQKTRFDTDSGTVVARACDGQRRAHELAAVAFVLLLPLAWLACIVVMAVEMAIRRILRRPYRPSGEYPTM